MVKSGSRATRKLGRSGQVDGLHVDVQPLSPPKSPNHRKASDGIDSRFRVRLEQLGRDGVGNGPSLRWGRSPHRAGRVWGSEKVETPGKGSAFPWRENSYQPPPRRLEG